MKVPQNKISRQKEHQKRYREQNREKLKQREAERRLRKKYLQSPAGPSTCSNTLNNEKTIAATISQSTSRLEKTQTASIQRNKQAAKTYVLDKKKIHQQRYREKNRDKLKQREAERRRRLRNANRNLADFSSPTIDFTHLKNEPITDETSTDSQIVAGLGEMYHEAVQVSQQTVRSQSSVNVKEIPNNYSQFSYQNREKSKQHEAEKRKRKKELQSTAGPSTSSNTNRIQLNSEKTIAATSQSTSSLEKTQTLSIQRNKQADKMYVLEKKKLHQQRYREKNRDKLKQREAERRRRLRNTKRFLEDFTSPTIDFTQIMYEPIIDEISTDARSVAGFGEMQHVAVEISQNIEMQTANYKLKDTMPKRQIVKSTDNEILVQVKCEPIQPLVEVKCEPLDTEGNPETILPDCSYRTESSEPITPKVEPAIKNEPEFEVEFEENGVKRDQIEIKVELPVAPSESTEPITVKIERDIEIEPEFEMEFEENGVKHDQIEINVEPFPVAPSENSQSKITSNRIRCDKCHRQIIKEDFAQHKDSQACLDRGKEKEIIKKEKQKKNANAKKYRCSICKYVSPDDHTFISHTNTHRKQGIIYKCDCGVILVDEEKRPCKKCKSKSPLKKSTLAKGKYCEICKKLFSNHFAFVMHAEYHIKEQKKNIKANKSLVNKVDRVQSKEVGTDKGLVE